MWGAARRWCPDSDAPRAPVQKAGALPWRGSGGQQGWGREAAAAGRGGWAASEARVHAQRAAGDVLQLPGHVVGHADVVVRQHLQHQPQVQPPLLPGHAVPAGRAGRRLGHLLLLRTPPLPALHNSGPRRWCQGPRPWARTHDGLGTPTRDQRAGACTRGWPSTPARGGLDRALHPRFPGTHSKSVSFLSSVTGLKATAFFRRPITQAESGALANTRPADTGRCYRPRPHAHSDRRGRGRAGPWPWAGPPPPRTIAIDRLELLGHPEHGLHPQLGPIVPVEGGRSPALGTVRPRSGLHACPGVPNFGPAGSPGQSSRQLLTPHPLPAAPRPSLHP